VERHKPSSTFRVNFEGEEVHVRLVYSVSELFRFRLGKKQQPNLIAKYHTLGST
jgi:hypothetical protein